MRAAIGWVLVLAGVAGAADLPVRDGLELWLDAGRLAGKPGDPVTEWPDLSGKGRHLRQPVAAARPTLADGPVVRFDGDDDHLRHAGPVVDAPGFSVFVVAAPRANFGGFRSFVASNAPGQRDYTSGFCLDLGPDASAEFDQLNVEGRGFVGAKNLLKGVRPYGPLRFIEAHADGGVVRAVLDGAPMGERPRQPGPVGLAEWTVGARWPDAGPRQRPHSFLPGDLAEVIVYGRTLTADEAKQVRAYLTAKHAKLTASLAAVKGTALVRVADPPPVQVLVPGFRVRELPVTLPNVNNVRFHRDGSLLAVCYNGDVHRLRDTDGDGLPDKATVWWDNQGRLVGPVGAALTPPDYPHGDGLFVACKGKVVLLADTDGDGVADKETVIASGWPASSQPAVDAVGVAFDPRDGSVYFGLGCADYANAYQTDKDGTARYRKDSERGTVLRVAPDLRSREVVCTGIRWPCGMAVNRLGDLFVADQEGATWLANGNPFDELLHIQKNRHYGFPPRHPKHLPGVIDEPSVFDYGPQHQSTCGLAFNEPVNGGPVFGPAGWAGDALLAGESRGKLYRTQLAKTPAGYVARTHLLACLGMLAVDCCVAPDGGLVVACHSGKPDWGTGPKGIGKLFKIEPADREHPQPVAVWAAGPREVRVAFDRPVDPAMLKNAVAGIRLEAGKYVRAGDRFETLRPGYKVVQQQLAAPRHPVAVRSAQLTPDRRTLVLATGPHAGAVHYALTLPGMGRPEAGTGELRQVREIDLDYDLSGVDARWQGADGQTWAGWLPHPDLSVARQFTAGSAAHDALWAAMQSPGELTLRTQLDLADMLRPAVQPGSRLDHEFPPEEVTLAVAGSGPLTVRSPVGKVEGGRLTVRPPAGRLVPAEITLRHAGGSPPTLAVNWHTAEDARPRALPLRRVLLPWATTATDGFDAPTAPPPEIAGGSWARGRKLFFGAEAGCSKCHTLHGQGGAVGPDLSNLVHRDYASVLRDIAEPSAAINPDFVTYKLHLHDGRAVSGTVRHDGDRLLVGDGQGATTAVRRADVEAMTPAAVSTMPEGIPKLLGPDRLRDLMTFLLTEPRLPDYGNTPPPPPRPRAEVRAALAGGPPASGTPRPLHLLLVAGPKDHGKGEHDYPAWQRVWAELLGAADGVTVTTATGWPTAEQLKAADVAVFYQRGEWDANRAAAIDAFLERGGGLVYLHWAVEGGAAAPEFARRIGLASNTRTTRYRHGPLALDLAAGHPVTRNLPSLKLVDESYWALAGELPAGRVLATAPEEGQARPLVWTLEPGRGRVFVSVPGHYAWTFDDPLFRLVVLRGVAWAAKEPVDRFNELVWPGARVAD